MIIELLLLLSLAEDPSLTAMCDGPPSFRPRADSPALARNWTPQSGLSKPPWFDIDGNQIDYIGACPEKVILNPPLPPVLVVQAQPCIITGDTQRCDFKFSWDAVENATDYQLEQRTSGDWYEIFERLTVLTVTDEIHGDPGNREICWRNWAHNITGWSKASNEECRTTPALKTFPKSPGRLIVKEN